MISRKINNVQTTNNPSLMFLEARLFLKQVENSVKANFSNGVFKTVFCFFFFMHVFNARCKYDNTTQKYA